MNQPRGDPASAPVSNPVRLVAIPKEDGADSILEIHFNTALSPVDPLCAPATLHNLEGHLRDLGRICTPTPAAWRTTRRLVLEDAAGPLQEVLLYRLEWAGRTLECMLGDAEPALGGLASLHDFSVEPADEHGAYQVAVAAIGLLPSRWIRLDSGAGRIVWLQGSDQTTSRGEWTIRYAKPGRYTLVADLLDEEGFWLRTLETRTVTVAPVGPEEMAGRHGSAPPFDVQPPWDVPQDMETLRPWLPALYVRPRWGHASAFAAPGDPNPVRTVDAGAYLCVHAVTQLGDQLWYRTAAGDWIAAVETTPVYASDLRGAPLDERADQHPPARPQPAAAAPAPAPRATSPPQRPPGRRKGVITGTSVPIYAVSGATREDEPVDHLKRGDPVTIQRERRISSTTWYGIGPGRWVQADWVQVFTPPGSAPARPRPAPPPVPILPATEVPPGGARRGIVTAMALNVRARPGVAPDNPAVDRLVRFAELVILEERYVDETIWYRIGDDRWVYGGWVGLLEELSDTSALPVVPAAPSAQEESPSPVAFSPVRHPQGLVTASMLNVRVQPGKGPESPVVNRLPRGTVVTVLQETTMASTTWYRIGPGRWVQGNWVRLIESYPLRSSAVRPQPTAQRKVYATLPVGWVVSDSLVVRSRPDFESGAIIGRVYHNQRLEVLETVRQEGQAWHRVGPDQWVFGEWVAVAQGVARPQGVAPEEGWLAVDLAAQTAVAYQGDLAVYAAMVATGAPTTPSPAGLYRLDAPRGAVTLAGNPAHGAAYLLESAPWTIPFCGGYALVGAYWHDNFGRAVSRGCVNFSPYDAWWLTQWVDERDEEVWIFLY